MPRPVDVAGLIEQVRAGSRQHMARAITLVESKLPLHRAQARELLTALSPFTGHATRVGITGVPGAGKSTFIDAMGTRLIEQGHKVAVLAVDPSSTRTGGSVLGDRTRMGNLASLDEAFIRPSPSGNHLGGVARATREAMLIVEAAGFDTIIVETVGVGQSEVAVAGMVDTFLMIALSRAGDQLQGIKRGILELADVIAVNKADGDNLAAARSTARELAIAMRLIGQDAEHGRKVPVLTCSALTKTGLDEVWQAVGEHRAWLDQTIGINHHRASQQVDWMWAQVNSALVDSVRATAQLRELAHRLEQDVAQGKTSALTASSELLKAFAQQVPELDWAR